MRLLVLTLLSFSAGCGSPANEPNSNRQSPERDSLPLLVFGVTDSGVVEGRVGIRRLPREIRERTTETGFLKRLLVISHATYDESAKDSEPGMPYRLTPLFSETEVTDDEIIIRSSQPALPGGKYHIAFSPAAAGLDSFADLEITGWEKAPLDDSVSVPKIIAVYPTAKQLPANHLKFYVHFSEPMQQGDIFAFIRLKNATSGEIVPRPFRHTELWSKDNRRLTLWFHPGRQKTGVNLNVEIGPVLAAGNEYELQFRGDEWRSRHGGLLAVDEPWVSICRFKAVAADHTQPDTKNWRLSAPEAGTTEPLVCEFDEPFDWALIHSQFRVMKEGASAFDCETIVAEGERAVRFVPREAWTPGRFELTVGAVLEDLAGNSLERPFEVDLTKPNKDQPSAEVRRIPFEIRNP